MRRDGGTRGTGLERLHTGTYLPVTTVVDISEPARQYLVACPPPALRVLLLKIANVRLVRLS
jgi:hypothetical protein